MKRINTILLTIMGIALMLPFASAAFSDGFNDFARFVVGDVTPDLSFSEGEILFVKLMVLVLLFALIHTAVKRIPNIRDNKTIVLIIALVASIIGVRYITTSEFINFIWLPYGVVGIVLSSLLPFLIIFFFLEGFDSRIIRKVGWSAFFVIFIALAYLRWDDLATAQGISGLWYSNLALIYVAVALISGLLILFGDKVHTWFVLSNLMKDADNDRKIQAARILRDLREDQELLSHTSDTAAQEAIRRRIREHRDRIRTLMED